jgi:uncharacterized protein (UPF0548 family)
VSAEDPCSVRRVPITFSRPSGQHLDALLARLGGQMLTYAEVGATKDSALPPGYRHDRHFVSIGRGDDAFGRGQEAIRRWEAHRSAGAAVAPATPPLVAGTNVAVTLRFGPAFVVAPARIVYVTDEPDRFGFAYGTLPGHPERGEEAFHVQRDTASEVSFAVVAFSRPADVLARFGGPVTRAVQSRVNRAYLEGVRRYVASER